MSVLTNQKIRVSDLDFESIKNNFKEYLRSTEEFSDYDYDASALSSLLDVLAYNTYYNAVMANFIANETFMDSAVKRESVVSLAKNLGYTPKSVKAAKAKIQLSLSGVAGEPNQLVLKTGTPFETTVKDISYQFVTLSDQVAYRQDSGEYNFGEFYIYQGQYQQNTFSANGLIAETFTLPNPNVDHSSISVIVQNSATDLNYEFWTKADNVVDVDDTSKVFYIQEGLSNRTQVYFGDGVLGKMLSAGNIVYVAYLTSAGQGANDAKVFSLVGNVEGNTNGTVTTIEKSSGGANAEDIDSIRFNAKSYFGVQNRAVTPSDYRALILQNFQNVKSCVTWGGEENDPPYFGKVFLCVQPKNTSALTTTEKEEIINILERRSVANILPIFADPEYIDLEITTDVYYDAVRNDKNTLDLQKIILDAIVMYGDEYLGKFDTTFRFSALSRVIDNSDYSILNNLSRVKMYKAVLPLTTSYTEISAVYGNAVKPGTVVSTLFNLAGMQQTAYLRDDADGFIYLYIVDQNGMGRRFKKVGTINYNSGKVVTEKLLITSYDGTEIKIYAEPQINDIYSTKNNIVRLKQSNIKVVVHSDTNTLRK